MLQNPVATEHQKKRAQDLLGQSKDGLDDILKSFKEKPTLETVDTVRFRKKDGPLIHIKTVRSTRERLRHVRQYAEGELSPEQSFYFRGPESKLNLRAQNLMTFLQLADGVAETWMHHLREGDYSTWFKDIIKDEELARQAAEIEQDEKMSAQESRKQVRQIVETRYTSPA
jgi:intein/homing endonuclease